MFRNFKYLIVFISAPGVLPVQNDWYWIQPWKVNEIKACKKCGEIRIISNNASNKSCSELNFL